jgi:hypothetical protein
MIAIDPHNVALISIVGSSLDVLGTLYLGYDLLGGEHGPLRTLTRGVTYGALFGTGYGLAAGPVFGLASGAAHGISLAWEFSRESRGLPKLGWWFDAAMSAIRGAGFALGAAHNLGVAFGVTFGLLSTVGQTFAYQVGIRPTANYEPAARPRVTRFLLLTAANRTAGYTLTGYLSSVVARHGEHAIAIGLRSGLAIGLVTAVVTPFMPFVEWTADHLPERRMGVFGVGLILLGFMLQSVQYWLALLDMSVR